MLKQSNGNLCSLAILGWSSSVNAIIWAIVAIIVLAWLIGWLVIPTVGSLIHVLIIIAVVIIIVNVLGLAGSRGHGTTTTTKS